MKVINRDISVAVLRQLVKIRREELESGKMKARAIKSNAPKCLDATALADRLASDRKDITILEGLAASGLRAIRYALEVRLQRSHATALLLGYLARCLDENEGRLSASLCWTHINIVKIMDLCPLLTWY